MSALHLIIKYYFARTLMVFVMTSGMVTCKYHGIMVIPEVVVLRFARIHDR